MKAPASGGDHGDRPTTHNPAAVGDVAQAPIVHVPDALADFFERTRCAECGCINNTHDDDCSRATR